MLCAPSDAMDDFFLHAYSPVYLTVPRGKTEIAHDANESTRIHHIPIYRAIQEMGGDSVKHNVVGEFGRFPDVVYPSMGSV